MKLKELLNTPIRRMVARNIALSLVVGICLLYVALRDTRHMYLYVGGKFIGGYETVRTMFDNGLLSNIVHSNSIKIG